MGFYDDFFKGSANVAPAPDDLYSSFFKKPAYFPPAALDIARAGGLFGVNETKPSGVANIGDPTNTNDLFMEAMRKAQNIWKSPAKSLFELSENKSVPDLARVALKASPFTAPAVAIGKQVAKGDFLTKDSSPEKYEQVKEEWANGTNSNTFLDKLPLLAMGPVGSTLADLTIAKLSNNTVEDAHRVLPAVAAEMLGSQANPLDIAMLAFGGPLATKLGEGALKTGLGKAVVGFGEKIVPKALQGGLKGILPRVIGSPSITAATSPLRTYAEDQNAPLSRYATDMAQNAMMDMVTTSISSAAEASRAGRGMSDAADQFHNSSKAISDQASVLNYEAPLAGQKGLADFNARLPVQVKDDATMISEALSKTLMAPVKDDLRSQLNGTSAKLDLDKTQGLFSLDSTQPRVDLNATQRPLSLDATQQFPFDPGQPAAPVARVPNPNVNVKEGYSFNGNRMTSLMGPNDEMLVARSPQGKDLGFLWYEKRPNGEALVHKVEVLKEHQRQGVATELYSQMADRGYRHAGQTALTENGTDLTNALRQSHPEIFATQSPVALNDTVFHLPPAPEAPAVRAIVSNLEHLKNSEGAPKRWKDLAAQVDALLAEGESNPNAVWTPVNEDLNRTVASSPQLVDAAVKTTTDVPLPTQAHVWAPPEQPRERATAFPGKQWEAVNDALAGLTSWRGKIGSGNVGAAVRVYSRGMANRLFNGLSTAQKALKALPFMEEMRQKRILANDAEAVQVGDALDSAIETTAKQYREEMASQGQNVSMDAAIQKFRDMVRTAQTDGTADVIPVDQHPELRGAFDRATNVIKNLARENKDLAPPSMKAAFEANEDWYQKRLYAKFSDPAYLDNVKKNSPELYQEGVDYFKKNFGLNDQEAAGRLAAMISDQGAIPNRHGQVRSIKGVSSEIEQRRLLNDDAKSFWDGIEEKKAQGPVDLQAEFNRKLQFMRRAGKEHDADQVQRLFDFHKKNNPLISDQRALQKSWEDLSLPPVIRDIMGEVKDPAETIRATTSYLASQKINWEFNKEMADGLAKSGLLSATPTETMAVELDHPDLKRALGVPETSKVFVHPQVKALLDGMNDPKHKNWVTVLQGAMSAYKLPKILSTSGVARNIGSSVWMMGTNGDGWWLASHPHEYLNEIAPITRKAIKYYLTNDTKHLTPEVKSMLALGVLEGGVEGGEVQAVGHRYAQMADDKLDRYISTAYSKGLEKAGKVYQFGDIFARVNAFQARSRQLGWARGGITADVLKEAAEEVKDTYQNYGRSPGWAKEISKNPGTGNLKTNFAAEMTRNIKNIAKVTISRYSEASRYMKLAQKAASEGNAELYQKSIQSAERFMELGMKQTGALGVGLTGFYAAGKLMQAEAGVTNEQSRAVRESVVQPGQENATPLIYSMKNGEVVYLNSQDQDPYYMVGAMTRALAGPASSPEERTFNLVKEVMHTYLPTWGVMGDPAKSLYEAASGNRVGEDWSQRDAGKDLSPFAGNLEGMKQALGERASMLAERELPPQLRQVDKGLQAFGLKEKDKANQNLTKGEWILRNGFGVQAQRSGIRNSLNRHIEDFGSSVAPALQSWKKQITLRQALNPTARKEFIKANEKYWDGMYSELEKHTHNIYSLDSKTNDVDPEWLSQGIKFARVKGGSAIVDALRSGKRLTLQQYLDSSNFWDTLKEQ